MSSRSREEDEEDDDVEVRSSTWNYIESSQSVRRSLRSYDRQRAYFDDKRISHVGPEESSYLHTNAQFSQLPVKPISPNRTASTYQFHYVTRRISTGERRSTVELKHSEKALIDEQQNMVRNGSSLATRTYSKYSVAADYVERSPSNSSPLSPQQRLSQYSLNSILDERDNIQKKTFTKWVNKHLTKTGLTVEDLFVNMRDGHALIALLEALTAERINKENGYTRFHRIQNVQYCLDFLKKKSIKLVNIRPEDIVEGNSKLTLGLIWTIILNFQVSVIRQKLLQESQHESEMVQTNGKYTSQVSIVPQSESTSARDVLLQWVRKVTNGYPRVIVNNFSSSWRDGLAFVAILHRYRPNCVDWSKISTESMSNRERLDIAFSIAEKEFGVSRLLDAEDVDTNNPDEKSIITYVSSLYNALPALPDINKLQEVQDEYIVEAYEFREWIEKTIRLVEERNFSRTSSELFEELRMFKEEDLPEKNEQKRRLILVNDHLEANFGGTEFLKIPRDVNRNGLQNSWDELLAAIDRRYEALQKYTFSEANLNDMVSRLERGIAITNEKLELILRRIEDSENRVDNSPPAAIERSVSEIIDDLNSLEKSINEFLKDSNELKENGHLEANEFYRRVYALYQRRLSYLDRVNHVLTRISVRTENLRKEKQVRLETIRTTSFNRVEECIEWVRVRMDKLTKMEFTEDLEKLERVFELHKTDNRKIQDFRANVDECIAKQNSVSTEDTYHYFELLRTLESEYQQLRDLSAGRMLDLDSLIAFVRAAELELIWVSEREDIEVTRNWSNVNNLDLPMLTNYYKQLLHEMELREKQFNDVHNQGAALLNQGHPAVRVIEAYLRTMQKQWDWLLRLTKCLEEHLRDAINLKSYLEEADEAEIWIEEQTTRLENNYNQSDISLDDGERYLSELNEIKDILNKYHGVLMALAERCSTISPLWQRAERISHPITITAVCDFDDKNVTIKAGDDIVLLDNSDMIKWTIRDLSGVEANVPSVVIRVPPPNAQLTNLLSRLLQKFEILNATKDKKHLMIRYYIVTNTMRSIQRWDINIFNSEDPNQKNAVMKSLNEDADVLLNELDPNDPLSIKLREQLKLTNEIFWELLSESQKPPEPDWSSQFDQKSSELLRKLNEYEGRLNANTSKRMPKNSEELKNTAHEHKLFEDDLQTLDADVANVKELFRQLTNPSPHQINNIEKLNGIYNGLWDLSRMFVERIKVLESVYNGIAEVADIVKHHEITLNSFDDLPSALDLLRGHHSQLLEINMVLKQQHTVIEQLNKNVVVLRQHVARTRINEGHHPDVDAVEEDAQHLIVRWENLVSQVSDRLNASERALQIQMVYRPEYETEIAWLDGIEETIRQLRKPEELKPEQFQQQLDQLISEYSRIQTHTQAIESVNKEGGKFIRDAKTYDLKMSQYSDEIERIHGNTVRQQFRRKHVQPKNGSQIVTDELELLNKRFSQLSSLILERRNTMQVLLQNWKKQKQENVTRVVSFRENEIADMMSDLGRFKQEIFTTHLTFDPNPQSIDAASKNVQKVKESLDSWRDRIKERLDAIDELCRDEADTMTPEQFSALREKRRQLAEEYDTVLRTVEGIHTRLNGLAALLIEFSSLTSSMQSWMTDRTRVGGEIRHKSADPMKIDEARIEAKSLLEEVQREESRLKDIGASVVRIEQEIEAMNEDMRSSCSSAVLPSGINVEEVYGTRRRVEDDYSQLLKQCQELLQFQNRVHAMNNEHAEHARRADEWLLTLENDLDNANRSNLNDDERIERIEELNRMAAGGSSQLDEAENASKKLLTALEGTSAADQVKQRHEELANSRKQKHQEVVEKLQQSMNEAASRKAEAEGVKQAAENLDKWSLGALNRTGKPVELPLNENELNEIKRDEQILHGEIESKLALVDELEKKASDVEDVDSVAKLLACRQRLNRSNSQLKGVRDNIYDALNGLNLINGNSEKLARGVEAVSLKIRSTNGRDAGKLNEIGEEIEELKEHVEQLEKATNDVCNIPNTTKTKPVVSKTKEMRSRVDSCAEELETKRGKLAELETLEANFDDAKLRTNDWLNRFENDLKSLEKVSIDNEKLSEQRKENVGMAERHSHAQGQLDELEALAEQLSTVDDPQAAVKGANAVRQVADLVALAQKQANELKQRADKINKNDVKATSFKEAEGDVTKWIERRKDALIELPIPTTKEGVKSQLADLERMDKAGRGEQRKVEEVRLNARELAREASEDAEIKDMNRREKVLADKWDELADQFDAARDRARTTEKLLDECQQIDKWLGGKKKMMEMIGAPSTDSAVARTQNGQIQLMKAETEAEKSALENVNTLANELVGAVEDQSKITDLVQKMDSLNRRWHSLEGGLDDKGSKIENAVKLGEELRNINRQLKKDLGDLESNVEKASSMSPNDIREQLSTLDSLKSKFGNVDAIIDKLKRLSDSAEDLEIDDTNRAEIQEQIELAQKKADELERKIDNVKKAALNAQNQGMELEKNLDELLSIANEVESELSQAAPISADSSRLEEEAKRAADNYGKLVDHEGEVSLLKAKLSDDLKKNPDTRLKAKLDELNDKWPRVVAGTRDRKDLIDRVADMVKNFNEAEKSLELRLKGDQEELDSLVNNDNQDAPTNSDVCDGLKLVEMTMARRLADVDALNGVVNRIETTAPGPDANRLRRKADNLADSCKAISKRARTAASQAQRKYDFLTKFDKLAEEVEMFVASQKEKIEDAIERDQMNNERVSSKLAEVEDFWSLKGRELKSSGEEIKKNGSAEDAEKVDEKLDYLEKTIEGLLEILKNQNLRLKDKQEAASRVQSESQKAAQKINSLVSDISDLEPIGRSREELKNQKDEIDHLIGELDAAETKLIELESEWDVAVDSGVVGQPAFETNKAVVDELKKLAARSRKRLAQREKKLAETEDEIEKLNRDADAIVAELLNVAGNEVLDEHDQNDPKSVSEKVKQLKESMKPIGAQMDAFNSDCKLMIKTAGPDANTSELDSLLKKVGDAWSEVVGKVSDKEMNVDAAVQQQGKVEDAYRALLNWLEETEEMLENQKKPSADSKVAKAQLHAYEVLMKHVEDKQPSIDGFATMISKMVENAANGDEKANLKNKNDEVFARYNELLNSAQDRQRKLLDAVDLSEKLQAVMIPLENWMNGAEKRLQSLSKVPISVEKANEMINARDELQDELEDKYVDLKAVLEIAPNLSSLVSVEDANNVTQHVQQLENRAKILDSSVSTIQPLLNEFLQQIQDYTLDSEDMIKWVTETENRLCQLDVLPIAPDDLIEQSNILADLAAEIANNDETMTSIFEVGKQLAIQGEPEEALEAQRKIDDMKFRYSDLMTSADEKIVLLAKAIPLSEQFHEGFEDVMSFLEEIEKDFENIDEEDVDTQLEFIFTLEDDVSKLRPTVDELTALSTQLQALCAAESADELLHNTVDMNRKLNNLAELVARKGERIEMHRNQSRAVSDDLCFLVDWFAYARDRILSAGPPSLDAEYINAQLKHQREMNDDVNAYKVQLKNVSAEAKKVARQLKIEGTEGNNELADKCDEGKELVDEVAQLCMDRTDLLERGVVLVGQLPSQFDDLNQWLDNVEDELRNSGSITTATPPADLKAMHDHNTELAHMMVAYRPIIDRFKGDIGALQEIVGEHEASSLGEVASELINRYDEVKDAVRARGQAIDNTMSATIGFGERLETLVANLQGAADRLKDNEGYSADPSVLEGRLAENKSIIESLRDKRQAYDALKQSADELLSNVPQGDAAADDVENKLNRLDNLWKEIEKEAFDRGDHLENVLEKAKRFWSELDSCQKAVDDLRNRLDMVEPATGHPEQLADQQEMMVQVANELERTKPRIDALSIAGRELASYVPDDEKNVIDAQVANVHGGFSTITALFADKKRDLVAAMEEAMSFHGDLKNLLDWLDSAEQQLRNMSPVESANHMSEIAKLLDELHRFRDDVDQHGVSKEQVVATANQLTADAPTHLAAVVRHPIAELNGRWTKLYAAVAEREHKLESSMLQMGKLSDAIEQLTAWMDKTKTTLSEIAPPRNAVNLRDIEIAQCKLAVISNDVHSHQQSVDAVNQAAIQYSKSGRGVDEETSNKLVEMNSKWNEIQSLLKHLAGDISVAKEEAENVGGEVDKWQSWLEETEAQLMSTKQTGGLPETAEAQLDEFRVLKAEVDQNTPALETHLMKTEEYLRTEKSDENSWMAKTFGTMKSKWSKVKELLVDREKKLQLAYEQAVALEQALNDMEHWIIDSERKLSDLPPISRLPDVVDKQLSNHEIWMDEVANRKSAMAQHQAAGVRMQYYCEKKDAIPIKNRLVSLKHRCEKIASRTAERGKQLMAAREEVAAWQDGVRELDAIIADVMEKINDENGAVTSSLDRLKAKLEEIKEAQKDVAAKQALFDITRKRGIGLAEHATRVEYKTIASANEKLIKRWNDMLKKMRDRLREAEQAVLEGGAFEESMNDLETWVDDELEKYHNDEQSNVHGDIDGVRALIDEENRRSSERKTKENGVKTVVKKADALLASGVDESDSIRQAKERLVDKWQKVEDAARKRGDSIKDAEKAAADFDAKTHSLLDWLAVEEQKIKAPVTNVKKALGEVENVKKEMDEATGKYNECLVKGSDILEKCQPQSEQTLRNWMRVVEARWKEVNEKVDEREFSLLEEEQKEKERDEQIDNLAKFAAEKRQELNKMIDRPLAQDLELMEEHLNEMTVLDSQLREKQPDVDLACKATKKGGNKNPAADMLSAEWKKLWLDAMGLQSSLDAQKALLEEMKRLEGWKWEDWKERYVEWNDHAKARVSDLFRRIDRLHTGNVPRQVFIDGIIGSKFPTSRLEMKKVADIFDKGDGMINAKEFINALRFDSANRNAKPQTDTEKITHEIERQKKTCSCCTPYQIEKISDNHYRFGDTHIKRMVRILRSTVMVRVGGGWESLDEFLHKHDPCRAKGRLNINMFPEAKPTNALDSMRAFTKNRHAKAIPETSATSTPVSGTPGPIMKIREKTARSIPMSGGLGGTAGYTVTSGSTPSRIPRAPSDLSAGRLSRVGSQSNSKSSLADSSQHPSRPSSRASSEAGDKQSRIPSLRMKKGLRYNPPK